MWLILLRPPVPGNNYIHFLNMSAAPALSPVTASFQASLPLPDPGFVKRPDTSLLHSNPVTVASMPSWTDNSVPPVSLSQMKKGLVIDGLTFV